MWSPTGPLPSPSRNQTLGPKPNSKGKHEPNADPNASKERKEGCLRSKRGERDSIGSRSARPTDPAEEDRSLLNRSPLRHTVPRGHSSARTRARDGDDVFARSNASPASKAQRTRPYRIPTDASTKWAPLETGVEEEERRSGRVDGKHAGTDGLPTVGTGASIHFVGWSVGFEPRRRCEGGADANPGRRKWKGPRWEKSSQPTRGRSGPVPDGQESYAQTQPKRTPAWQMELDLHLQTRRKSC